MEKPFIWLASFPKSGNTWVRMIISRLLDPTGNTRRIEDMLTVRSICTSRRMFSTYVPGSDFAPFRVPAMRAYAAEATGPSLVKTHGVWGDHHGHPQFSNDVTRGAILVVRNPFDVVCSCMNHFGMSRQEAVRFLFNPNAVIKGDNQRYDIRVGGWSGLNNSWFDRRGDFPLCVLRYEDLMDRPISSVQTIVSFLNLNVREADIVGAINATRFERLQAIEARRGFHEASSKSKGFFYKGSVGYFPEVLGRDDIAMIADRAGRAMQDFGYGYDSASDAVSVAPIQHLYGTNAAAQW